jgi:hypothetical protein
MASRPLSKKKMTPKIVNRTPNPVRPIPISVQAHTRQIASIHHQDSTTLLSFHEGEKKERKEKKRKTGKKALTFTIVHVEGRHGSWEGEEGAGARAGLDLGDAGLEDGMYHILMYIFTYSLSHARSL